VTSEPFPPELPEPDASLLKIVYFLDSTESDRDLQHLADDYLALLTDLTPYDLPLFVDVPRGQRRFVEIATRFAEGQLSRTSWLSFLSKLDWPGSVREAIQRLHPTDFTACVRALRERQYSTFRAFIAGAR
jgi:hypothetical protein